MIVIKCHECKRKYNWAGDAFCPHCGAFNQADDYGFDREPIEARVEEMDSQKKSIFQMNKPPVRPPHAPDRPGDKPPHPRGNPTPQQAQASGCLKKVVIAIVVWNLAMILLGLLMQVSI